MYRLSVRQTPLARNAKLSFMVCPGMFIFGTMNDHVVWVTSSLFFYGVAFELLNSDEYENYITYI